MPRIIPAADWQRLERGLAQRVRALNMFLRDIYHEQAILKAGIIPARKVLENAQYRSRCRGCDVPGGIYAHMAGIDVVRAGAGEFYVLEDNLRVPSGVSYMLENRKMMMRLFPELFARERGGAGRPLPRSAARQRCAQVAPDGVSDPTVVLLTPGSYNSAYFEHTFLAQQMGIELVEGQDLVRARRDGLHAHHARAAARRRDLPARRRRLPRPAGVPPGLDARRAGLFSAYRAGRVTLANAIGTGVADDKSIYPYVPEMIRFYLGEEPILNNVPTCMLLQDGGPAITCSTHLHELVVKEVHGSGGYGMLVGPAVHADAAAPRSASGSSPIPRSTSPSRRSRSRRARRSWRAASPRATSICAPTCCRARNRRWCPAASRASRCSEGSLVVNSSQGGGTKDTWVLER